MKRGMVWQGRVMHRAAEYGDARPGAAWRGEETEMNDTTTMSREEKRDALDAFAQASMPEGDAQMLPVSINTAAPAIVGSQPIAGARRDHRRVLVEIKELAAAAGNDWFYRFPVQNRREGRTDWIEGPSIKLAMAVMGIVGNIEVDVRVQDFGQTFMIYARAIDLEKGSAVTRAFQQNKSAAKIGGADDGRRTDMALQIGQSKAIRNAICGLLELYTDFAFEEAKGALVDRIGSNLDQWRSRTVEKLGARVDIKRVEAVIGRTSDRWLAPDVARVIAMAKAVEDGMASMDETFPPIAADKPAEDRGNAALDEFAKDTTAAASNPSGGDGGQAGSSEPPATAKEEPADVRGEIGMRAIALATDKHQSVGERLQALEIYRDMLREGYPALTEFIEPALKMAAAVAKGETPADDARKYVEGLIR